MGVAPTGGIRGSSWHGCVCPRLASTMRADRVLLGKGIGAFFILHLAFVRPDLLRFRSLLLPNVQSTRLPSTAAVCGL